MDKRMPESRHSDCVSKAFLWGLFAIVALILTSPSVGDAQVVTNITSSGLGTSVQPPSDGVYNIAGGTRPGDGTGPILFHSFGDFSVGQGDIANFLNDTHIQTSNIIGRVTELGVTHTSYIYGTIQTTDFDTANLFLVNPSGFVFGPHGSLNVGGSVSFSTAQYLRLFDGVNSANFYTNPASDGLANSVLAVAPVVDFGFLSPVAPAAYGFLTAPDSSATITVQGSALSVPSGQSISLIGGKVTIQSGTPEGGTAQPAQLLAPSGSIKLASAASPGEFDVNTLGSLSNVDGASFTSFGAINLAPGSSVDVSGARTVFIKGGQLVLSVNDATLSTSEGAAPSDTISLSSDSNIGASNLGAEPGAEVGITVGTLNLAGSAITTQTSNARGGDVRISADTVVVSSRSRISSATDGIGDGGEISIRTQSLDISQRSAIDSNANASGRGGNIVVSVQEANLSSRGSITSLTNTFGSGAGEGGTITVQGLDGIGSKADSLTLAGSGSRIISNAFGTGRLGDVDVHAKTVSLTNFAAILGGTQLSSAEKAGNVTIDADLISISDGGRIASQVFTADAGQMTIAADQLTMNNGTIQTATQGPGHGGNMVLNVGSVSLENGASINSSTGAAGRAGDITMNVGTITLTKGSQVSSASTGTDPTTNFDGTTEPPGRAGNITITATGSFTSDASSIATSAEANHGGDISITAQNVQLSNGTLTNANSNAPLQVTKLVLNQDGQLVEQVVGDGNAGNITINSDSNIFMKNSSVTTKASQASGGQVTFTAPDMIQLVNGNIITSVAGFDKDTAGGNITIDPQFVVLQNSQILAQANAGAGGAIDIIATSAFIADPVSIVDASSTLGISGTVNIQSPLQNVGGELAALTQEFSSAAALLAQQCAARVADGKFSTFVVAAREGLPIEPGGFLASPSLTTELLGSRLSGRDPQTQLPAITGLFPQYDARPIQLAKLGSSCR